MPTFVLRLIAPRPNFAQTITDSEREIMNRHAAHWRPYLDRGDMVVFGPILTDDDSYGIAVVETDDEQALREFAAGDPVVTTGHRGLRVRGDGRWDRARALTTSRECPVRGRCSVWRSRGRCSSGCLRDEGPHLRYGRHAGAEHVGAGAGGGRLGPR